MTSDMSTRYEHKDYGTTELRNYGATELRNYGTTELRRCGDTEIRNHVDGSEMTRRWLEDGSKKQASTPTPGILNEYGKSMARSRLEYGWSMGRVWLRFALMVLMMIVEVNKMWGQDLPFTPTTDTNGNEVIDESEKHYYMIQSYVNTAFYMRPNVTSSTGVRVNTLNIITDDMKWYFLPVSDESGFYYICDKENRYMYFSKASGSRSDRTWMQLKTFDNDEADKFKFSIAWNSTKSSYNIIPKGNNNSYCLNKQGGNAGGYNNDSSTGDVQIYNGYNDEGSCWNFVAVTDYEWSLLSDCFQVSTDETIHYYRIQNKNFTAYYIKPGATYVGTSNSTGEDNLNDMTWYFKEAGSNGFIQYYYIIHANTGKYLRYLSNAGGNSDATDLAEHTGSETEETENRFKFIIVRGTIADETVANNKGITFNIVPKLLENAFTDDPYKYYCLTSTNTAGSNLNTANMRSDNKGHWNFVTATYTNVWADPVINCGLDGKITITGEDEAEFYYKINNSTTPPATPTNSDTRYDDNNKPTAATGFNTIKVRAIKSGKQPSNVVTKTIIYNPTITFTAGSYTYTGAVQNPISSVDVSTTNIASTEYNVTYKKGGVVADFKDAGDYTIELTDKEGGDYIVYGSTTKSIAQASVTVTADAKSKGYGDADPELTFTTTALQGSDTQTAFTGALSRESGEAKGTYTISQGSLSSANYAITFIGAVFTITNKTLTITAGSDSKIYDGTALTKNSYTNTGLLAGDVIESVTVAGSQTNAGSSANVPSGAVIKNSSNENVTANYEITYVNGTLEVTQKPITITAGSDTKEYDGTALTKNTYTNTALVTDQSLTNVTVTGSQTVAGSSANVPSAAVIQNAGSENVTANYNITYTNGTLTVTQKALTITAGNATKVYDGTTLTKNNYTSTTLATGDAIESVTINGGQTTVGCSSNVPSAAVIKNSSNETVTESYNITYTNGTLEVTRASVTVTADNLSKSYRDADPATFTATITGLVNNELESLITYTTSRASGEGVGEYAITPTGDATQGNYTVSYVAGTFTITPKALNKDDAGSPADGIYIEVTKDASTNPATYSVTVKQGEDPSSITLTPYDETEHPIDYDYTLSAETSASGHLVTVTAKDGGNYSGFAKAIFADPTFDSPDEAPTEYAAVYLSPSDVVPTPPSGVTIKAYIVRRVNPTIGTITISEIDYFPEGIPILLISNDANAGGLTTSPKDNPDITEAEINSNQLLIAPEVGVTVKDKQAYMFYKGEFVLTKAGTIKKDNFYILNPNYIDNSTGGQGGGSYAPRRTLQFVIDNSATGIEGIIEDWNKERQTDEWFTIDGLQLNSMPVQNGFYIINGEKVIIK